MSASKELSADVVEIDRLSHDGRGIGQYQHKKVFVRGALPQELVQLKILKKRSKYSEGEVTNILKAASSRVVPPCSHASLCGGCSLQHIDQSAQLDLKQHTLLEQLQQFGQVTPRNILPPLIGQTTGYRHKARLGVKFVEKKNKLLVGFREKASRYLADIDHCVVLHPTIGERLNDLASLVRSLSAYQHIAQIEVAIGDTDKALVFRHLVPLSAEDQAILQRFGEKNDFQIYLQPNKPDPFIKLYPADGVNRLTYSLPQFQLTYHFHPLDFTQVNPSINQQMVKLALSLMAVKKDERVLDLFCGIGNFTLPLAQLAEKVTGIEGSVEMVERGYENAAHNQLSNVEFFAENLENPNTNSAWLKGSYDKILLDPPRVGAKDILPSLATFKAKRMVYVSCNAATLARDAGELVHKHGWTLETVGIMNMFPHTTHSEAIALFTKG